MLDREAESLHLWGKRPRGRPSRFTAKLAEKIYASARYGLTDAQTAEILNIGIATLHRWKRGSASFKWKLQEAKAEADERVERSLFALCRGMTLTEKTTKRVKFDYPNGVIIEETVSEREIPPDLGAIMVWLYNRRPDRWSKNPRPAVQSSFQYFATHGNIPSNDPKVKLIVEAIRQVLNGELREKVRSVVYGGNAEIANAERFHQP